jgi:hypothetical protein
MLGIAISPHCALLSPPVWSQNEMSAFEIMTQDLDSFVAELASQPLVTQPGTRWQYSWAIDVLGTSGHDLHGAGVGRLCADSRLYIGLVWASQAG